LEELLLFNPETLANVTIEDCEEMYRRKSYCAICNDGQLEGFVLESETKSNHLKLIWFNRAI
jgi:hypothetical protein